MSVDGEQPILLVLAVVWLSEEPLDNLCPKNWNGNDYIVKLRESRGRRQGMTKLTCHNML